MPSSIYDIDFRRQVRWNTPYWLRTTFWLTWLGVLVYPIAQVYQSFLLYAAAKRYDMMITSQVCYLEMMLNDRYDGTLRRIYISDSVVQDPVFLYEEDELHPVILFREIDPFPHDPLYIYTDQEGSDYGDDFVIWVPTTLTFDPIEMRKLVMRKRLPGMRFSIQPF